MYDVLHDADYRRIWDDNMLECYEICQLDRYNDIGYYSSESISFSLDGISECIYQDSKVCFM